MKQTKEQLAEEYAEGKSSSSAFKEAHKRDFIAGFDAHKEIETEQLKQLKQLGINKTEYFEAVQQLIHRYIQVSMACEFDEEERFRLEIERLTKKESN